MKGKGIEFLVKEKEPIQKVGEILGSNWDGPCEFSPGKGLGKGVRMVLCSKVVIVGVNYLGRPRTLTLSVHGIYCILPVNLGRLRVYLPGTL